MKRKLRLLHKYLSLTVAALWLMQAVTGALLVFHWELDDWAVAGSLLEATTSQDQAAAKRAFEAAMKSEARRVTAANL